MDKKMINILSMLHEKNNESGEDIKVRIGYNQAIIDIIKELNK